jgi:hypothetical protein
MPKAERKEIKCRGCNNTFVSGFVTHLQQNESCKTHYGDAYDMLPSLTTQRIENRKPPGRFRNI